MGGSSISIFAVWWKVISFGVEELISTCHISRFKSTNAPHSPALNAIYFLANESVVKQITFLPLCHSQSFWSYNHLKFWRNHIAKWSASV
jgi:hypothetical protein